MNRYRITQVKHKYQHKYQIDKLVNYFFFKQWKPIGHNCGPHGFNVYQYSSLDEAEEKVQELIHGVETKIIKVY
jgi:hypothetical protein